MEVKSSGYRLFRVAVIARVGIFSAIGILLGYLSLTLAPIIGNQVALDLSHLGTMASAIFVGPFAGFITGGIVGIPPSLRFGNPLIAVGKLITGFCVALVFRYVKSPFLAVVLGYIPESLITYLTLGVFGIPYSLPLPVIYTILGKAWIEIGVIGVVMEILWRTGLRRYASR